MLAAQVGGSEFDPQNPEKKGGTGIHACKPYSGGRDRLISEAHWLASLPLGEFQASKKHCLRNKQIFMDSAWEVTLMVVQ